MGHINLKSGSSEFAPDYTAADFRFTFDHTLSKKFSSVTTWARNGMVKLPMQHSCTQLSLGYLITDRLTAFVESYSFFPEETKADHRLDAGFIFKITPVVQWDISAGLGLNDTAPDSFISTGISFRLLK